MRESLLYASNNAAPPLEDGENPSFLDHIRYGAGLEYIKKRSKDGSSKVSLDYIELPAMAFYETGLPTNGAVFGGLGPYVAYGFGGKVKSSFSGQTDKVSAFGKDGFKRFDAGLRFSAGYRIKDSFSFTLDYDLGLANLGRNAPDEKVKNRTFSLTVGYPLAKLIGKK